LAHLERLGIGLALLLLAFGGYFWIGGSVDLADAATLATPLDARIPFIPASIYVYAAVYVLITLPIFVVESPALFRRIALAYLMVVVVCLACFRAFPVSGAALRPDLASVEASPFVLWGLHLNYGLDRPVNLFPSLHLAGATIAALGVWKARRRYGAVAGALVLPVAISICTVKQHYWVDGVAGIALAVAAYAGAFAHWVLPPGERAARGLGSWVAFLAVLASVYGALYAAFRAGLEPWRW